ncbi:MAG: adenosine deaminase [Chloroflexota bacterium]|nr:adenosine deaminase [Chloroflexota bacterium]
MNRTDSAAVVSDFIQALPKAEVHVHLLGTTQPQTVLELARRNGMLGVLPAGDVTGLQRWFAFTDFPHFIKVYLTVQDLIRTPDDLALVTYECGADMAAQNIRYREVTFTPYTHIDYQDKGLVIEDIMCGLEAGRRKAQREFGVEMRWVFDIPRSFAFPERDGQDYDPHPAERTLEYALEGRAMGVVGFGLGGLEVGAPPFPFAHAFAAAKDAGLLSVPHAGETEGPESVWGAVDELQADRIGHGVRAIEDPDLLVVLKERQIPLEVNPTSNVCLHVYRCLAEHPLPHLDRMGLLVTVNSDDPPLFNTTLVQEYRTLVDEFGYTQADLIRLARNAFVVCGAEAETKARLLAEFDQWVAGQAQEV